MISKINLIGAFCNLWGVEHHVFKALKGLGYGVERFDHRRGEAENAVRSLADMTLVLRGDGIPPDLVRRFPGVSVLWHGEIIHPSLELANEDSNRRLRELAINVSYFDFVFHAESQALETIRGLGAKNVFYLHTSGVDPEFHRKLDLPKVYDVGFAGSLSQRRKRVIDHLKEHGINIVFKEVFGEELNRFINECKIFLNIHFTDILTTETRLNEILGAGSFALSEEVSMPDMYIDREHLVYWKSLDCDDLVKKIEYYLEHDREREEIALNGFNMVHSRYTYTKRCKELLDIVDKYWYKIDLSKYKGLIGVMFDSKGREIFSLEDFYRTIKEYIEERKVI